MWINKGSIHYLPGDLVPENISAIFESTGICILFGKFSFVFHSCSLKNHALFLSLHLTAKLWKMAGDTEKKLLLNVMKVMCCLAKAIVYVTLEYGVAKCQAARVRYPYINMQSYQYLHDLCKEREGEHVMKCIKHWKRDFKVAPYSNFNGDWWLNLTFLRVRK